MGSKYVANRLFILSLLARGTSELTQLPSSADMTVARAGIAALGATVQTRGETLFVTGVNGMVRPRGGAITLGDSGTFARLAAAAAALATEPVRLHASAQLAARPMTPLYDALRAGGVVITEDDVPRSFPVTLRGPLKRVPQQLDGTQSSQFLSALLLAAPYMRSVAADGEQQRAAAVTITLKTALVSRTYVELTMELMRAFGAEVELRELDVAGQQRLQFVIPPHTAYRARTYAVAGDVVAASYFWALALIHATELTIVNYPAASQLGEAAFINILKQLGAQFYPVGMGLRIVPPAVWRQTLLCVNMGTMPDVVPTLAVLACFAAAPVRMENIAHLRYKESNRIAALAQELAKFGVRVEEEAAALTVYPMSAERRRINARRHVAVHAHGDHRLAMALALMVYGCRELSMTDYQSVTKSFPHYFTLLAELGFTVQQPAGGG